MEKLIIDRSKWRTGRDIINETGNSTLLLNHEGFMCCLGFDALRCGIEPEDIKGIGEPDALKDHLFDKISHLVTIVDESDGTSSIIDSDFAMEAIAINDAFYSSQEERENDIKKHFATIEVEVEFIGEYVKKK